MSRWQWTVLFALAVLLSGCEEGPLFLPDGLNGLMIRVYAHEIGYYREIYPPDLVCVEAHTPLCHCDDSSLESVVAGLRPEDRIDINTASAARLESLPGIGAHTAAMIIESRPFDSVEGLLDVRGIGPRKLRRIVSLVRVHPL